MTCSHFIFFIPAHFKIADTLFFGSLLPGRCNRKMIPQGQGSWEPQVTARWPGRVLANTGAVSPHPRREGPVMGHPAGQGSPGTSNSSVSGKERM